MCARLGLKSSRFILGIDVLDRLTNSIILGIDVCSIHSRPKIYVTYMAIALLAGGFVPRNQPALGDIAEDREEGDPGPRFRKSP